MKKPSVGHVVVIVAIFLSIGSLPLFLGKKDSSKSPEPVPVSPGVPSQTVQSDTELAKQVEDLYYLVPFCEKNKTEFNWAKCFAKSDTLRSRIKLLTDSGTPPPERDQARNYVRSFLASEPLTTTKDRLQKDIGNHLKGIPDNFWNSVELQQQVTRAKQLASLADPVSLKLLLSSARPEVRKTAVLLKAQRPLFQAVVSKFTAKQDCKLNEAQSALRKSRAPVLTVPDGVAFCDFPPEIVITSKVGIYEAQMPREGRAFDQILKSIPKLYADELLVSSEKQALVSKMRPSPLTSEPSRIQHQSPRNSQPGMPQRSAAGLDAELFLAVVADRLDRAALERFHTLRNIFLSRRLLLHIRIAALIVAGKEGGGSFPAKVTIDALLIDEEFSGNVMGPFVRLVRHSLNGDKEINFRLCQAVTPIASPFRVT